MRLGSITTKMFFQRHEHFKDTNDFAELSQRNSSNVKSLSYC